MKLLKFIPLIFLVLAGCSVTPLVEVDDGVSIYMVGEPVIKDGQFSIKLQFRTPTNHSHLIQKIVFNGTDYHGLESFRMYGEYSMFWQRDHHFDGPTYRTITIMPGVVAGADEALDGFAMLPANWPPGFNEHYTRDHEVRGMVLTEVADKATTYIIRFDGKVLEFRSRGKIYTWPKSVTAAKK
jgi:hypothetical protein